MTFTAARFDRAAGARIYTLNLIDELAGRGTRDLERLLGLVADGRLDPGIAFEGSSRDPATAIGALLGRRVAGKAVRRAPRRGEPASRRLLAHVVLRSARLTRSWSRAATPTVTGLTWTLPTGMGSP